MMELIEDSFDIRCCECGEQITIFKDDLDTDVSFYDHGENGMGVETRIKYDKITYFNYALDALGLDIKL